jgi:hypothetical protein
MTVNRNDLLCGAIFILIGAAFATNVWLTELSIGNAIRMGPGFFPLVLAGLLVLLGLGIIVSGVGVATPAPLVPQQPVADTGLEASLGPWRGVVAILASPIIFGLSIQPLGLIPSLAAAVFVASFASRRVTLPFAVIMTATLTLFCYLVFVVGLRLPLRLFGPWLDPLMRQLGMQ